VGTADDGVLCDNFFIALVFLNAEDAHRRRRQA
jgi:hypothetical protein